MVRVRLRPHQQCLQKPCPQERLTWPLLQDTRKELDTAVGELQEKAKLVDMLHDKLLGVNNTLAFFDGELQVGRVVYRFI